jgi:hypothetical protein
MNTTLTVTDPLADQTVTILITLPPGEGPRDERPALVSLGVAEQAPVVKTGTLADLPALIQQAWTAYGVRLQLAATEAEAETVAEEQVVDSAGTEDDDDDNSAPTPQATLTPPKPQAKNLSLF